LLFNDLPDGIRSPVALYADDFSFWESGSSIKQLNDLCQRSLAKVAEWCERWGFKVSQSKSTVLFAHKRKYQKISLKIHEEIIPLKTEHRFLGGNLPKEWYLQLPYSTNPQQMSKTIECHSTANWHDLGCSKTTAAKHLQSTRSLCGRVRDGSLFLLIKIVPRQT